ncbi:hypothetical protein C1I89_28140 [Achromobacter pulmonis]|uniref:Uncharacterized protein n=1 Tax=Achromobacter pulmonis TaxID=1389932 RepID=A0A2N8KBL9_9BURK|nr:MULTISPECIES: hypothetical protein [Pseudomonadota]PND30850.1 hypothetical protein C1I89_28140 [Achromobacter pulmonis]
MTPFGYSKPLQYRLEGHRSVTCEDPVEWSQWFATADRRVAETWVDDVRISTVFLGLDHNHLPDGDPILFETEVYAWENAEAGHAELVAMIQTEMAAESVQAGGAWDRVFKRLVADQSED